MTKKPVNKAKTKKASKNKKVESPKKIQSLKKRFDKFIEAAGRDGYIPVVKEISDTEVAEKIFPQVSKGKIFVRNQSDGKTFAKDASVFSFGCKDPDEDIGNEQYNGPIPLGFRTFTPESLPLQGVFGKILRHFAVRNFFLGFPLNAWAKQNAFVSKACDMPGEDAVACGYELTIGHANVPRGTKEDLGNILQCMFSSEEFSLDQSMRLFESNKRCFGGALAIPCFEEEVDMSAPLVDYSQLKGKTFIGWTVIDPYYIAPEFDNDDRALNDPTYKYYLEPTWWNVYGGPGQDTTRKRIHRSWCFFRRHIITSAIYRPTYLFFGPSVPQMILERLYSAEVCANESSMLLRAKRTFVVEADVRRMIANPKYAKEFIESCTANATNWGIRLVERGSNAKQMDTLLSECMSLTTAQYGILCAEIGIPAPKFMMAQLTGFANSGNYEIKLYADSIKKIHTDDLIPLIRKTVAIQTACMTGIASNCKVKFGNIDIPTVIEEAKVLHDQAQAIKFLAESEAVKKLANQKSAESHKTGLERAQ